MSLEGSQNEPQFVYCLSQVMQLCVFCGLTLHYKIGITGRTHAGLCHISRFLFLAQTAQYSRLRGYSIKRIRIRIHGESESGFSKKMHSINESESEFGFG